LQAVPAKAISIPLLYISSLFSIQLNAITLTLCYISRLAFKGIMATGTFFDFMFAHGTGL